MSMNRADILYDCIGEALDEYYLTGPQIEKIADWLSELHDLADPQATELRNKEIELEQARECFGDLKNTLIKVIVERDKLRTVLKESACKLQELLDNG